MDAEEKVALKEIAENLRRISISQYVLAKASLSCNSRLVGVFDNILEEQFQPKPEELAKEPES